MKLTNFSRFGALLLTVILLLPLTACGSLFRPATGPIDTTPPPTSETDTGLQDTSPVTDPPETTPPPPDVRTLSFIAAGDNLTYYGNVRDAKSCAINGGRTYNFAPAYKNVAERIASTDISFINQETLMCGEGYAFSYYPYFNSPQDLGYDLVDVGFDVINIANNHMLDKGADGLAATIDFWNSIEGITLLGGYKDAADYANIRVVEKNGIRVAFLSYTFFTNYLSLPATSSLIVPSPDEETVRFQVAEAKNLADFVIVSAHWGDENTFTPNAEQRKYATLFAEVGVDAVIGHHPHVIQPVEWISRPDGGRMLCVYSLGNFVAEMDYDFHMLGGMIAFDMVLTDGVPTLANVEFIPTVYYYDANFYKNQVYYYTDFTEALAQTHGLPYYGRVLRLSALTNYLKNTIAKEFMPSVSKALGTDW